MCIQVKASDICILVPVVGMETIEHVLLPVSYGELSQIRRLLGVCRVKLSHGLTTAEGL